MLIINLEDPLPWNEEGDGLLVNDDAESAWHVWRLLLLISLRDKATSVRYHSWRVEDALAYTCNSEETILVGPLPWIASLLPEVWLDALEKPRWRWSRRFMGRKRVAAGRFRILCGGLADYWYASAWSMPGASAVDLTCCDLTHHNLKSGYIPSFLERGWNEKKV